MLASTLQQKLAEYSVQLGFNVPTPIQKKAWPIIIRNKNCLISAPTGSGKTEAVILPVLVMLSEEKPVPPGVRAVYVTPLRSLNRDLLNRIKEYARRLNLEVEVRHGDTSAYIRRKTLLKPPSLLVTTPETLGLLLSSKLFKHHLKAVEYAIIDEMHDLMSNKRGSQLLLHLTRLEKLAGRKFVRIGISATLGDYSMAKRFLTNDEQCAVVVDHSVRGYKVDVVFIDGDMEDVAKYVEEDVLRRKSGQVLVFCNTRDSAELLGALMKSGGKLRIGVHHGSLSKESREEVEASLKSGALDVVVCTSSLELGIDIGKVSHVYQIDSPRQVIKLVQRIGRSSHTYGEVATGTVVCKSIDDYLEASALVELLKSGRMESIVQTYAPFDVLVVQIVGMAIEKNGVSRDDIIWTVRSTWQYNTVELDDIEECIEFLVKGGLVFDDGKTIKPKRRAFDFFYSNISTIPDVESYEVKELASGKRLGQLDEKFVAENLEDGQRIILRGDAWRIVSINDTESTVFVERADSLSGATPVWTGEMIPVERFVAKRVGNMRQSMLNSSYQRVSKYMRDARESLHYLPDSRNMLLEVGNEGSVFHTCLGTRMNNALQLLISGIFRSKFGSVPRIITDPYRIFVLGSSRTDFVDMMKEMSSVDLEHIMISELMLVRAFHYALWQSAKRFGIVAREAKYDKKIAELIIQRYRDSILVQGVIEEMLYKKYDVKGVAESLEHTRKSGGLNVVHVSQYSSLANMLSYERVLLSLGNHEAGVRALREGVLRRRAKLVCLTCGSWSRNYDVFDAPESAKCPLCNSRIIAICSPFDDVTEKIAKKQSMHKMLTPTEQVRYKKAWKSASLYLSFGRNAIIALSSYGVGEDTAARVLRRSLNEEELFRELYLAQRNYVLYRKYWEN